MNGSWTSWSWNNKDRRYALWEVSPEVRYYIGKEKRGYIGAMYKAGAFNYKLSGMGKQGDLIGGGITGGYQLRLTDAFSLDFNLAVGGKMRTRTGGDPLTRVSPWYGNCFSKLN